MILKILILVSILACNVLSQKADLLATTQSSYTNAVSAALGYTSIAVLSDISGGLANPALVFSNEKSDDEPHGTITAGFGRDSIFDRYIIPAGISYSTNEGSLAVFYRGLSGKNDIEQHEVVLNLSGQLFGESDGKGSVDLGVNLRYENFSWKSRPLDPLYTWTLFTDTSGNKQIASVADSVYYHGKGTIKENRFLVDVGFFQRNAWENIDFGLTLRNLLGYVKSKENPTLSATDYADTVKIDSIVEYRKEQYEDKTSKTKGWSMKPHRTVEIGANYHNNITDAIALSIPMDLKIYGLLDKKAKNRFVFSCGMQISVTEKFHLRGGYKRGPGDWIDNIEEFKYRNILTGGAGIDIDPISFDFFITKGHFGLNAVYQY